MIPRTKRPLLTLLAGAALAIGGCDENDRVARTATEAADRQAAQNVEMARVAAHAAAGSKELVAADAAARRAAVALHQEIQAERGRLDAGWSALESERRAIAAGRTTVSALAIATRGVGIVFVALLALALAWLVLGGPAGEPDLGDAWEVVADFSADRLEDAPVPLPSPDELPLVTRPQEESP
ncbi:MAG: hypothetical protein KF847_19385 [Pirellulales bacterium]|nr:hypothetical protein [Pirellulales bacterium]